MMVAVLADGSRRCWTSLAATARKAFSGVTVGGRDASGVAATLIPVAAVFQVFDGTQVISASILRGAGELAAELLREIGRVGVGVVGRLPRLRGEDRRFADDPHWRPLTLFHEYFDGDRGRGCGASHQTGWTALVTRCLEDCARIRRET